MKHHLHTRALLLAGVSSLATMTQGWAAEAQSAANAPVVEEIVVTGSRIAREGSAAPTPLTIISADELLSLAPSNIADALNKLPQLNGSRNIFTSSAQTLGDSGPLFGSYLNLRALGRNRNLILLDGQRVPPTYSDGTVDTNVLPQALVSRVDVVTGGAAAVYGSDAVSGAVNYVLDKKYTGVKGSIQGGISKYGDAPSQRYSIAAGRGFANDKMHIIASFESYDTKGVGSYENRPRGDNDTFRYTRAGTGTAADPFYTVLGLNYLINTFGGSLRSGSFAFWEFLNDGSIRPIDKGVQTGASFGLYGGGGWQPDEKMVLIAPVNTQQAFARGSYEVDEDLSFYAQASYGRGLSADFNTYPVLNNAPGPATMRIYQDNAYLRPDVRTQLFGANPAANASYVFARMMRDLPAVVATLWTQSINASAGVDGSFGDGFNYNVNFTHGVSKLSSNQSALNITHYAAALDAVRDPTGKIVCRVSLGAFASLYPDCVPINMFGEDPKRAGLPNPAAINFIKTPSLYYVLSKMDIISGSLRGDLFDNWAGPVKFAAGGEYRRESLRQTSNSSPDQVDRRGLRADATDPTGGVFGSDTAGQANGKLNVKEIFGEVSLPLMQGQPFAQFSELDLALRHTDYSTSGPVQTWKLGFSHTVNNDLRFRGTVSRDIRAPNIRDLFAAVSRSSGGFTDVHTGVNQAVAQEFAGNPDLDPEKGTTYTIGAAFRPSFFPGLSMTIDYYKIKIVDAISQTSAADQNQECEDSGGTAAVCQYIIRPLPFANRTAANFPTILYVRNRNLSSLSTSGVDFEVNYSFPVYNGKLTTRVLASYLQSYTQQAADDAPLIEYAGYRAGGGSLPIWRGSLSVGYSDDTYSATLFNRMTGNAKQGPTQFFKPGDARLPNVVYTDLTLEYKLPHETWESSLFLNITNLMDVTPPLRSPGGTPGLAYPALRDTYDVMGRYFTAGVRFAF